MKRALLLSGGAFRGAFQLPILKKLSNVEYDYVGGVSVGSLNGIMFSTGKLDELEKIWLNINTSTPFFGVPGFMSPSICRWKGLYSLKPLRKQLKKMVDPTEIKGIYMPGYVSRTDCDYRQPEFNCHSSKDEIIRPILASCAMAGIHEPWVIKLGDKKHLCCDGGHIHPIPQIPFDVTKIDVVVNNPIDFQWRPWQKVDGFIDSVKWALEMQYKSALMADYAHIEYWAKHPANSATVYAPKEILGGMLDSSKEAIAARIEAGKKAYENPIIL